MTERPTFDVTLFPATWTAKLVWRQATETREEMEAICATLPKMLKVRIMETGVFNEGKNGYDRKFTIWVSGRMAEAKGNPANETGLKRFKKLIEVVDLEVEQRVVGGFLTVEEALAHYEALCE